MHRRIWSAIGDTTPTRRLLLAVVLATALAVAASWVAMLAALDTGLTADVGHGSVASDLHTFVTAGRLVIEGDTGALYEPARFEASGVNAYLNPPFFAVLFIPLAWLPVWAAWAAWTAVALACLVGGLHLLGVRRPGAVATAATLSYPVFLDLKLGQAATLGFLLVAFCYRFLHTDRGRAAGVAAGLLAYKPWLLASMLVWWLVDHGRRRAALAAAVATAGVLVAVSVVAMPAAWAAYPRRLVGAAAEYAAAPIFEYTVWHSIRQVAPEAATAIVAVIALVVSGSIVAGYVWFLRAARAAADVCFSAAVVAAVLLAPHQFPYDWVLLIVPAVLLARSFPALHDLLLGCGAALAVVSILSWPFGVRLWEELGWSIPVGYPTLLVIAVVVARKVLQELGRGAGEDAASSTPGHFPAIGTAQAGGAADR